MLQVLYAFVSWFFAFESLIPAIIVTIAAALFIACSFGATCSPCKEHDEFFHRHVC